MNYNEYQAAGERALELGAWQALLYVPVPFEFVEVDKALKMSLQLRFFVGEAALPREVEALEPGERVEESIRLLEEGRPLAEG